MTKVSARWWAENELTVADTLASSNWAPPDDPFTDKFESMTKTPILTSFIPSLPNGTAFRVSIHSWIRPQASSTLRMYKSDSESTLFQARIYVDGILRSTRVFNEGTMWPEVLNRADPMRAGQETTQLAFPDFHPEVLQQAHWEASEQLGRIRVVLGEGVMKETRPGHAQKFTFDRLRDVVVFAFQHAPLRMLSAPFLYEIPDTKADILEHSAIAWPNTRLFQNNHRRSSALGSRMLSANRHLAHGHSPQTSLNTSGNTSDSFPPSYRRLWLRGGPDSGPRPRSQGASLLPANALVGGDDPFIGPTPTSTTRWRSQMRSTDESMSELHPSRSEHNRTETEMSGVDWPKRDFQKHIDEAAIEEIIRALSPSKKDQLLSALSPGKSSDSLGLHPPSNTPLTAEASKQPTPELDLIGGRALDLRSAMDLEDRPTSRAQSVSSMSSGNQGNTSRPRTRASSTKSVLAVLEQGIVRRSTRGKPSPVIMSPEVVTEVQRDRSSSTKRKRSPSPSTTTRTVQKIIMKSSPRSNASDDKENVAITEDNDIGAGVSITA